MTDPRFDKFKKQMLEKIKKDGYNDAIINLAWNIALLKEQFQIYKSNNIVVPDNFVNLDDIEK